ncbi:MAG: phosphotransferase [Agarilytica sp.]
MTQTFESELKLWVTAELDNIEAPNSIPKFSWQSLNGDAGFRKYFRLGFENFSLIAVFAPPKTENNEAFVAIDTYLRAHGVQVPKIIAYDAARGFLLLEDLGEKLFLDYLDKDSANSLYGLALLELLKIQQCPVNTEIFPSYDASRLKQELSLFPEWFVTRLLGCDIGEKQQACLDQLFDLLIESALEQPQVIVHRDYHSRNLVYGEGGEPGVVDFQDAVIGPFTYDPVSLLRDCYIEWPKEDVQRWMLAYASLAVDAELIEEQSEHTIERWFDLMGMQRHIKVLGIFARLSLRDDKHSYLNDLPLVIKYVRDVAAKYEQCADFLKWFDDELLPIAAQQSWFREPKL